MGENFGRQLRKDTFLIIGSYITLSILWILFSDRLVGALFEPEHQGRIQSYKGIFFVLATALFLLILISNKNHSITKFFHRSLNRLRVFQNTFEQAAVGIVHFSTDGNWLRVNNTFCEMLGYSRYEIKQMDIADLVHPEDVSAGKDKDRELITGRIKRYVMKKRFITKQGDVLHTRITKSIVNDKKGHADYLIAVIEDINEEHRATQELKTSLHHKELLIKEIHHRVKNNLGLISGLLELQYFNTSTPETQKQLQQAMLRIKCMGIIHESFYQSEQFAFVTFNEYLENFVKYLKSLPDDDDAFKRLKLSADTVELDINQAIPLGLLLNEIITNLQFDDPRSAEKSLHISLQKENTDIQIELFLQGVFPHLQFTDNDSIEANIIRSLLTQLKADFSTKNEDGLKITIRFEQKENSGPSKGISPHMLS